MAAIASVWPADSGQSAHAGGGGALLTTSAMPTWLLAKWMPRCCQAACQSALAVLLLRSIEYVEPAGQHRAHLCVCVRARVRVCARVQSFYPQVCMCSCGHVCL